MLNDSDNLEVISLGKGKPESIDSLECPYIPHIIPCLRNLDRESLKVERSILLYTNLSLKFIVFRSL